MDFEATLTLLKIMDPFIENSSVDVSSTGKSDLVVIDKANYVGFEVFANEIIVFYFTDHTHFEDYTSELHDGEENYIERAKAFLLELFTYKIRRMEYFKGDALSSEKYFMIYGNGRADVCIGNTRFGFPRFINPFGKKSERSTTWQFDKAKGLFTTRLPKVTAPDAIEVIDINENCYIEIFSKSNVYTYEIMEICYDDYYGLYYWAPASGLTPSGFYDTKENAINSATEVLKLRNEQATL
ncbi:MAG: hypothetical protein IJZ56_06510 [Oscillospiraceae bacterium]|nr:hypothetical protein [Oscillospiraceae bacterium]